MIQAILVLWLITALLVLPTRNMARLLIYFGAFSLMTSFCFLLLGAPDVAMAEAAISVFTTIFFIVCFEKYYNMNVDKEVDAAKAKEKFSPVKRVVLPLIFTGFLLFIFIDSVPDVAANTYLRDQYIFQFMADVGGENPVTAIYLGYRVYDTLFEALMLVISVVAVSHMSWYGATSIRDGRHSEMEGYGLAVFTIRIICPLMLLFGVYIILNGQFSPGGGFQGGLAIATFFICRYMIYNIYDLRIEKVMKLEELIFASTILVAIFVVFLGASVYMPAGFLPIFQDAYLFAMNTLIGMKVACAFFVLFYRYVAIERK